MFSVNLIHILGQQFIVWFASSWKRLNSYFARLIAFHM